MPRICSLLIAILLQGCTTTYLLPSVHVETTVPWTGYGQAKAAFDRIVPNHTTLEEIRALGFDPHENPNVEILTYVDIIRRFMPVQGIGKEDLAPEIRRCIEAREKCRAFEVRAANSHRQRYGSVFADLLNFQRNTRETGWQFDALIIMDNGVVIYTLHGGRPSIEKIENEKNPLGPLQGSEKLIGVFLP